MVRMSTLIYTHEACFEHRPGPHHPESPERLAAVLQALKTPEFADAVWREAPMGSFEQVLQIHTPEYVENVQALSPQEPLGRAAAAAAVKLALARPAA